MTNKVCGFSNPWVPLCVFEYDSVKMNCLSIALYRENGSFHIDLCEQAFYLSLPIACWKTIYLDSLGDNQIEDLIAIFQAKRTHSIKAQLALILYKMRRCINKDFAIYGQ